MANSESQFHKEFRDAIKAEWPSAHVFKASDRHIAGIVDIYSCTPKFGTVWVELKFERDPKGTRLSYPVALTELQRQFIKKQQRAGGQAGWCLCVKVGTNWWRYFASSDYNVKKIDLNLHNPPVVRKSGHGLDVENLLSKIVRSPT